MSANLFDLFLARAPRLDKLALEAPDGHSLSYGELFARARPRRARAGRSRRRAGRPGRRADRQVARRDRAGAGLLPGGRGAAAAQYRLYARRTRIFPLRRRPGADALPAGSPRAGARARRQARPDGGRKSRRAPRRQVRRGDRGGLARVGDGPARARRSRRHSLHFGHDGALEGRDADARESLLQRRRLADLWRFTAGRRADPCAAGLSYPRAVRRHQRRAARRRDDDLPAALRRRRRDGGDAARDFADGRADVLHPPARPSRPDARGDRAHAAVRQRLRAAARRDARALARRHRPRDPRALRHDRDRHDHVESL